MGNSRFSDGFLFGALVGGAVVFLLGTRKGNRVLKIISEEGIDGLTRFVEETSENIDNFIEEKDLSVNSEQKKKDVHNEEQDHQPKELVTEVIPVENVVEGKTKPHRFFKRTKKASN
jgi:hypothetical protein